MSNYKPHESLHAITSPCLILSWTILVKYAPCCVLVVCHSLEQMYLSGSTTGTFIKTSWHGKSALLNFLMGIQQLPVSFPYNGPVMRTTDVYFGIGLTKLLKKQSRSRWTVWVPVCTNGAPSWSYCSLPTKPSTDAGMLHDDVIKWKYFPRYWPFVRGIHRLPVNSPHKGQRRGALMFSLICALIYGWVNNRYAGDLRRHRTHYDVIVMNKC